MLTFPRHLLFQPFLALAAISLIGTPALAQGRLPIRAGVQMKKGAKYVSKSGNHHLVVGPDGNLVVTSKDGKFVWGVNLADPKIIQALRRVDHYTLKSDGFLAAIDAQGNEAFHFGGAKSNNSMLNVTFGGVLQIVAGERILWASDGNVDPPIKVFLIKADITRDQSLLASEPGWAQCWRMRDPAINIFATNRVSHSAINAVANIYREMTHRLHPSFPRKDFNGFKVYITNGESRAELKKLNTVGTMWKDGTGPGTRDFLRGGANSLKVWISEQMICKTGVKTRRGKDKDTRTFDQVVHEFAHSIDQKFIGGRGQDAFREREFNQGPGDRGVEGFAWAVQYWFRAPSPTGKALPSNQQAHLSRIFTSRPSFSPEGYGATPSMPGSKPTPPSPQVAKGFPEGEFYMTTRFMEGQGLVLESAPLMLKKRDRLTGMYWKAKPAGNGYYYLTTQYLEPKKQVLEGGNGQSPSLMVTGNGATGTRWKAVPAGNGYFFLTNAFLEKKGFVLEGNVGEGRVQPAFKGAPFMTKNRATGTQWKFIPLQ